VDPPSPDKRPASDVSMAVTENLPSEKSSKSKVSKVTSPTHAAKQSKKVVSESVNSAGDKTTKQM